MESPQPLPTFSDDLLEEIFLRIGSPADLVRTSIACVAFRRLIADPTFLRRYRSLHPPLLLCLLDHDVSAFQPAEAPHPSAALAAAVSRSVDFSAGSYIPGAGGTEARWKVGDVRDGRVLIECFPGPEDSGVFDQLAVCDPVARRCLLLPPIPDDLLASIQVQELDLKCCENLLVPSGEDDDDDTSFRVITRADFTEVVVAFIFSSASGHWSAGTSVSWDALSIPSDEMYLGWHSSYVHGCFYWKVIHNIVWNQWLRLDMSRMEFSAVDLPPLQDGSNDIIVEAGEGRLGMFTLINRCTSLLYTIRQIRGERFDQMVMNNAIPLPAGFGHCIYGPYEGYIFILGYQLPDEADNMCFMLDIKTLEISRVCRMRFSSVCPYFGFPPSMSQRRI